MENKRNIINPDDQNYYDNKLYKVGIWPGAGYQLNTYYVYADSEETALDLVVVHLEIYNPSLLSSVQEVEDRINEDYQTEFNNFIVKGEDNDIITFASDYLNLLYIDATMNGATQPYFIENENLIVEEVNNKVEKKENNNTKVPEGVKVSKYGKRTEAVTTNETQVANWLKETVDWLVENEAGCGTWKLDDRLAICVGWSAGYDKNDTSDNYIHSKEDPTYCINAAIKVWTSDDMRTDLDWINCPYDDENTYDDSYTISKNENYNELAKSLLQVYSTYKDCEIDKNGKITSRPVEENKSIKEEARLTDYLGILQIRDILQKNPETANKEFAIKDNMIVEVGVGNDVNYYKATKNDDGEWELLKENIKKQSGLSNAELTSIQYTASRETDKKEVVTEGIKHFETTERLSVEETLNELLGKRGINTNEYRICVFRESDDYAEYGGIEYRVDLCKAADIYNGRPISFVIEKELICTLLREPKDYEQVIKWLEQIYTDIENGKFDKYKTKTEETLDNKLQEKLNSKNENLTESINEDGFQNSKELQDYFEKLNDLPDTIELDNRQYTMTEYGGTGSNSWAVYTDTLNDDSYIRVYYSLGHISDGHYKGIKSINGVSDLRENKQVKTEYYNKPDDEKVIWSSEFDIDNVDKEDLKNNQYQDYLDSFDSTVTPMSYDEWLDSDECSTYFDLEWEDAAHQDDTYADWYPFITDYVTDEEKQEAYDEYVESCKQTTLEPDTFEEWLDNQYNQLADNDWEIQREDLEQNILPSIDTQLNDDILILSGYYGSNYPDFKSSGNGGKMFEGTDEFRDYMGGFDETEITSKQGILGAILSDHDGTVSGQFYTLPVDKTELIKALDYANIIKDRYDEEDLDKYNEQDLMETEFNNDLIYGGLDVQDLTSHLDLLVPIKDTISGYTPDEPKGNKTEALDYNSEPITSGINADSCKINGDIVTGNAELVQYDGFEYNPVSDEFTFEYNRKSKTVHITSDNKAEIEKNIDNLDFIDNMENNILPELTKENKTEAVDYNIEPIVSSINADSCKINGDVVTGSAELVQYDGSEYNPVSDEFTFEYNRKDKTVHITSDNEKEIVKDLDEEEIMNNIEDNILPEITKVTESVSDDKLKELADDAYYGYTTEVDVTISDDEKYELLTIDMSDRMSEELTDEENEKAHKYLLDVFEQNGWDIYNEGGIYPWNGQLKNVNPDTAIAIYGDKNKSEKTESIQSTADLVTKSKEAIKNNKDLDTIKVELETAIEKAKQEDDKSSVQLLTSILETIKDKQQDKDIERESRIVEESKNNATFEIDYSNDDLLNTDYTEQDILKSVNNWLGNIANEVTVKVISEEGPAGGAPIVQLIGNKELIGKFLVDNYNAGNETLEDIYDLHLVKENKNILECNNIKKVEAVEYISKKEYDKLPAEYKTTIAQMLKARQAVGDNAEELRKLYKELGYNEEDPMVLANEQGATILKPVKIQEEKTIATYKDNSSIVKTIQANNGRYFNYYYDNENDREHWSSSAGPFSTPEEAETMVKKHRPQAVKTELEEATSNSGIIREELNTGVLPIVDVDMYSMEALNEYDVDLKELDDIVMELAPKYIEDTLSEILVNVSVVVKSMYHPKQYNYSGDELEFTLSVDKSSYETLKENTLNNPEFADYLKTNYSSSSGFVSYMADNIDEFNTQDSWKQMVQVIMFNIPSDKIQANNEQYMSEFMEKVSMNYSSVDDDNDNITEAKEPETNQDTTEYKVGDVVEDIVDEDTAVIEAITDNPKTYLLRFVDGECEGEAYKYAEGRFELVTDEARINKAKETYENGTKKIESLLKENTDSKEELQTKIENVQSKITGYKEAYRKGTMPKYQYNYLSRKEEAKLQDLKTTLNNMD